MKLPRRRFLHLAAGAAALSAVSRIALAQASRMALLPCFLIGTEPSRRALSSPARAARSSACHFQCRFRAALRTRGGHKTGPISSGARTTYNRLTLLGYWRAGQNKTANTYVIEIPL
ncbi:MAG TPA: hypothetical protein VKB89_11690 [Xanthobacteraceae bacterium]|nr:hypothetical protein [Xanthobacteraceae bacterium]